ncbi:hypothetical protein RvY_06065 [Ramazzottius varieornatus]|uniref:DOMON domain-containing protein n=1 Tax=Ramazzottius varieornatus TaxID=947166 RepID=A0A1D1UX96_RAMVA|nr:hypothetical protein RvY_06065 [Ramazzottius varieornatus]
MVALRALISRAAFVPDTDLTMCGTTALLLALSLLHTVTGQWNLNLAPGDFSGPVRVNRNNDFGISAAPIFSLQPSQAPQTNSNIRQLQNGPQNSNVNGATANRRVEWWPNSDTTNNDGGSSNFFPSGAASQAFTGGNFFQPQPQVQPQSAQGVFNAIDTPYYGTRIGNLNTYQHSVAGEVYAIDDETILVKRFSYDGQVPDASFCVGNTEQVRCNQFQGVFLNNDKGQRAPLTRSNGQDIILKLNSGGNLRAYRWLALTSPSSQNANFGDVMFPRDFSPPKQVMLGPMMPPSSGYLAQSVRSGPVTVINDKQIQIGNLYYDGAAAEAFFYVGQGPQPNAQGAIIPYANSYAKLPVISGQTVTLTLPGNYNIQNINWLAIWSRTQNTNLGYVMIPSGLNVPPALAGISAGTSNSQPPSASLMDLPNCESFANNLLQVRWGLQGQELLIQVQARLGNGEYMAFGFSGTQDRISMLGSDVIVIYWDAATDSVAAEDYTLASRQECMGNSGVCPDDVIGGGDSFQLLSGSKSNDVVTAVYRRPINSGDRLDLVVNPNIETYVVWAIGPLNEQQQPRKHYEGARASPQVGERIVFGRNPPVDRCSSEVRQRNLVERNQPGYPGGANAGQVEGQASGWRHQWIMGNETNTFVLIPGPAGGVKGYSAVTRKPKLSGLVWYVNGKLAPELVLQRGQPYRFIVYGGMNFQDSSKYHPLYITTDSTGGLASKLPAEQVAEERGILAGAVRAPNGAGFIPTALGPYCAFVQGGAANPDSFRSFEEFNRTLALQCDDAPPRTLPLVNAPSSVLDWIPSAQDPPVAYYQCFIHKDMGWRIKLVNDYREFVPSQYSSAQFTQGPIGPNNANGNTVLRPAGIYTTSNRNNGAHSVTIHFLAPLFLVFTAFLLKC